MQAAVDRFGRIDVLVNNAGNFYAGFFEELTPEQIERQLATNLIGPMNVTRAVLPVMRKQRSGHIVTISLDRGHRRAGVLLRLRRLEVRARRAGWSRCGFEVEPFGIHTTIVEPGFFRTELLTKQSTAYADLSIDDYAERTARDPARLGSDERQADQRSRQARAGPRLDRRPGAAAAPLGRRRRRGRNGRAEGRRTARAGRCLSRPVVSLAVDEVSA